MEIYLIGKYRPKYNTIYNKYDVTLYIDEPDWFEYKKNEFKKRDVNSRPIVKEILEKHRQIENDGLRKNNKNESDTIKSGGFIWDMNLQEIEVEKYIMETINEEIENPNEFKNENDDLIDNENVIQNDLGVILIKYGLSQSELAKKTKCSKATISNIARGVYTPSLNLALRISKVLNLPVQDIFYFDEK